MFENEASVQRRTIKIVAEKKKKTSKNQIGSEDFIQLCVPILLFYGY